MPASKSVLPTTEEVDYLRQNNQLLSERVQELTYLLESSEPQLQYAAGSGASEGNLRHELDEAMRSLHEKDVRLEEFTWEVTKVSDKNISIYETSRLNNFLYFHLFLAELFQIET